MNREFEFTSRVLVTNDEDVLQHLGIISLVANRKMAKEMAEAVSAMTSPEELRATALSIFNDLVECFANTEAGKERIMLFNFIGIVLENGMNIAKMQESADARLAGFEAEIARRSNAAS